MRCNSGLSTPFALFLLRLPFGRPGLRLGPSGLGVGEMQGQTE